MSTKAVTEVAGARMRARTGTAVVVVGIVMFCGGVLVGASGTTRPAEGAARSSVLDQAEQKIAAGASKPIDDATLERAAVQGMLDALGDKWAAYYSPEQFSSFTAALEGHYTGIGVWVRQSTDGATLVASVQPTSPAARAGLRPGDVIVSIGGHPVASESVATVTDQLHGAAGSSVSIAFARGGDTRTVTVQRQTVETGDIDVQRLPGGVLHLSVDAFSRGVGQLVAQALAADPADHAHGVLLDLRGDPGGLVDEAVKVAGAFLDGGRVVSYQQRGATHVLDAAPGGDTTTPLVVLVDNGTASAAEIVAAALQDRDRAVIVGSRTFGKGSVQEPTTLSNGSAIEFTVGRYLTPSGRSIDGVGVVPDVTVSSHAADDVALDRGLDVLRGLAAGLSVAPVTSGRG
jgi:carboxyl-terminal processing protease